MRRLFVILILLSIAFAEIPATLSYQGKITDTDGIGLNGTYPVTFKIYDDETGGTELWSESHSSIMVNKGLFSVILGNISPLELPFDEQYWLEIVIDGDDMSPRQPINAVAYAFRAGIADSLAGGIPEATGDTMIAHWDSIRNVPDDIMQEGEDISLLNNDANYIDTVITDSTLSGDGAISPLSLAQRGATDGQVLKWHDSSWRPMDESAGSSNAILNQADSVQTADFKISGDGELSSIRLKPNSSGTFPETAAGTFATIGVGETFKVFVNDGECWHELSYNEACNTFGCGICEDYDGNIYSTVQIGDQCWMAENLKTTHYKDGTPISHVTNSMSWSGLDISSTGAYCYFLNDTTYINDYGFMYNWYAVDEPSGLCPDGWHLPTDEEWKELEIYLGMSEAAADSTGRRGTNEASKLAGGADLWSDGALDANAAFGESGFLALPGGSRSTSGYDSYLSVNTYFWTTKEIPPSNAIYRRLHYNFANIARGGLPKVSGFYVRCIKGDYSPLRLEIIEPDSDTLCLTMACTLSLLIEGGAEPFEYDWNLDGLGDWDDEETLIFEITEECDTLICQIRDYDMNIDTDTLIIYAEDCIGCGTVTDIDGNEYATIQLGTQCWFSENLKTTHYRDGSSISHLTDNTDWENTDATETGAYCAYDNDPTNIEVYGLLYNWYAIDDARGLCPDGWHVPTDTEWKALEMFLGMSEAEANDVEWRGTDEGCQLAGGYDLWTDGSLRTEPAFATSGFNALPGGSRDLHGIFDYMGRYAHFYHSIDAGQRGLGWVYKTVRRNVAYETFGYSVRCVQGDYPPLHIEIEQTETDTLCLDTTYTFRTYYEGGIETYDFDWNIDGLGEWDDNDSIVFTLIQECDTLICQICDGDMTIKADTLILYGVDCECRYCIDYDGNSYDVISLGDQCWMAENLKTTHYRDGVEIPNITDDTEWDGLSTGAYCAYDNDPSNISTYGLLYNWYAVDDIHGLCPDGWHIPTDDEWKILEMHLGMSSSVVDNLFYRGTNEGSKLADRADLWRDGTLEANPEFGTSGFMALPAGLRMGGSYDYMIEQIIFWTFSEYNPEQAWMRGLIYNEEEVLRLYSYKPDGFSVRCVKGYLPLEFEIEEPASSTHCLMGSCTLRVSTSGGALPFEYDWDFDGTGDWDDDPTLIFDITDECDTFICMVRDAEMNVQADTIIINAELCSSCGIWTDYDGNEYETVVIGDQCWMAENLKTTHYRDGTPIAHVTDNSSWATLSTDAYCEYGNDPANVATYGRLYNWYAVDDARGLCPDGWRVPNDNDYKTLEIFLGMDPTEANGEGMRGTNQGSQLAGGYDLWESGALRNDSEFGTSGFMALPAGLRDEDGNYIDMLSIILFWSSSEQSSMYAWQRYLYYANSASGRHNYSKIFGLSVRCIRE